MKFDVVFVHGWAMNSAVWRPCLERLPPSVTPQCIDLPGYGACRDVGADTLDDFVDHVAHTMKRPAVLVGWSLGGLVALRLAQRYPEKVASLVQVASSPKFVQAGDWRTAIEGAVFEQFAASLETGILKTVRRFLALQVRGTDTSMATVRALQQSIEAQGLPVLGALLTGLKILSDADLRGVMREVNCPVTWLLGEKDMLVPVELADALRELAPDADIRVLPGAGHALFLSDPDSFVAGLMRAVRP